MKVFILTDSSEKSVKNRFLDWPKVVKALGKEEIKSARILQGRIEQEGHRPTSEDFYVLDMDDNDCAVNMPRVVKYFTNTKFALVEKGVISTFETHQT